MAEDNQPQVEEAKVEEQPGETPQVEPEPKQKQLGAEGKPQEEPKVEEKTKEETPRTYSEEEWAKRQSALDKQVETLRQGLAQMALQVETGKQEQTERDASVLDRKEVDDGVITTAEADKRQSQRTQQAKVSGDILKQQQTLRQMAQQTEQYGRVLAAQDFGKTYELTPEQVTELLEDKDTKTPGDMKAKAADLALERERGKAKKAKEPPKYDKGQSGGESSSDDKLKKRYPSMHKK